MDLQEKRQKVLAYTEGQQVSDSVIIAATAAAGKVITRKKEGETLMCTFFDELVKEGQMIGEKIGEARGEVRGEARGEARGEVRGKASQIVEMGFEFGLSVGEILQRLQGKLNISMNEAEQYLRLYSEQKA